MKDNHNYDPRSQYTGHTASRGKLANITEKSTIRCSVMLSSGQQARILQYRYVLSITEVL